MNILLLIFLIAVVLGLIALLYVTFNAVAALVAAILFMLGGKYLEN